VIGGRVVPRWEISPTPLAEAVAPFALAVCDEGEVPLQVDGVVGAGLCVRRNLLRSQFDDPTVAGKITDRKGSDLIGGGDLVIAILARKLGWECWYEPSMNIEHCLPSNRMTKTYLLNLYAGIGRGQAVLRRSYDWKARTPLAWFIGAKDIARWVRGIVVGPPSELRLLKEGIGADLHDLSQRLTLARALRTLCWPIR
jgi:hypothetical protein